MKPEELDAEISRLEGELGLEPLTANPNDVLDSVADERPDSD